MADSSLFLDLKLQIENEIDQLSRNLANLSDEALTDDIYVRYSRQMDYIQGLFDRSSVVAKELDLTQANPQLYALLTAKSELSSSYGRFHRIRSAFFNRCSKLLGHRADDDLQPQRELEEPLQDEPAEDSLEEFPEDDVDENQLSFMEELEAAELAALEEAEQKRARAARQKRFTEQGYQQDRSNEAQRQYREEELRRQQAQEAELHRLSMNRGEGQSYSEADLRNERLHQDDERLRRQQETEQRQQHDREVFEAYRQRVEQSESFERLDKSHIDLSNEALRRPDETHYVESSVPTQEPVVPSVQRDSQSSRPDTHYETPPNTPEPRPEPFYEPSELVRHSPEPTHSAEQSYPTPADRFEQIHQEPPSPSYGSEAPITPSGRDADKPNEEAERVSYDQDSVYQNRPEPRYEPSRSEETQSYQPSDPTYRADVPSEPASSGPQERFQRHQGESSPDSPRRQEPYTSPSAQESVKQSEPRQGTVLGKTNDTAPVSNRPGEPPTPSAFDPNRPEPRSGAFEPNAHLHRPQNSAQQYAPYDGTGSKQSIPGPSFSVGHPTMYSYVPGGIQKTSVSDPMRPSEPFQSQSAGTQFMKGAYNVFSNAEIYKALTAERKGTVSHPIEVSPVYEHQMRFNLEKTRLRYVEAKGTPEATEWAKLYKEQRNVFTTYLKDVREQRMIVPEQKPAPIPAVPKIPTSVPTHSQSTVFSYTPTGIIGRSVENGRLSGSSYRRDVADPQVPRAISRQNPLRVTPEYEAAITRNMLQATGRLSEVLSTARQPGRISPLPEADTKLYTDAYLAFQKAKLSGTVVVNADAPPMVPDFHAWQDRRKATLIPGTTVQSKTFNPNQVTKASVEETVANIFNVSSKLKRQSLTRTYLGQLGTRFSDYSMMAAVSFSRKMYRLAQSGDDNNALRTAESGRYYGVSMYNAAWLIRNPSSKKAAAQELTQPLHKAKLEFKRYGTMSQLTNTQLSAQVINGIKAGRERKVQIKNLSQTVKDLDQKITLLNEKIAGNIKTAAIPWVATQGTEDLAQRLKQLQGQRSQLADQLSTLKKEHAAANREIRKGVSLQKFRHEGHIHDKTGALAQAEGKLPKNLKQMDEFIAKFSANSRQAMEKKFGTLSKMTDKSLSREIKQMRKQGETLKGQIKLFRSKGSAATQAERKLLSDLMEKHKSLNKKLGKLYGLSKSRADFEQAMGELRKTRAYMAKRWQKNYSTLYALQTFLLKPLREGSETGAMGLVKLAEVASNRYVHIILKQSFRATIFLSKGTMNVVLPGSVQAMDNAVFLAKTAAKVKLNAGTNLAKKTIKTGVKRSVGAVKSGITHITPNRIKTAAHSTAKVLRVGKSKYDTVATGIKNLVFRAKNWFANTRLGQGLATGRRILSGSMQSLRLVGALVKKILVKLVVGYLAVFLLIGLFTAIPAMLAGSSASSVVLSSEESTNEKINLAPYAKILAEKREEFDSEIAALKTDSKYTNVEVEYKTGELDNSKEILSMMAVRLGQDLDIVQNVLVSIYLNSLFDDSHHYVTTEREYECSGCKTEKVLETTMKENGEEVEEWVDKKVCPGHTDLKIDIYIYDFDEIFTLDSMGNATANFEAGSKIGNFKITHYCACTICCGPNAAGITASGKPVKANHTIAVDPDVIPLGTHVFIDGKEYVAEDTGGAIQGNRIDIYVEDHQAALNAGVRYNVPVYSTKVQGGSYQDTGEWDGWTADNIEWCKLIFGTDWNAIYDFGEYGGTIVGLPESGELVVAGEWIWPVTDTTTSSGFGWRIHPITGEKKFHNGTDIPVATGTQVHAAGAGTVTGAGYNASMGNYVIIDHGNGVETRYYHNSRLMVSTGDAVTAGQVIALSGNTGDSTGPHLHFEFRVNGTPIDPRVQYNLS